MRDGSKVRSGRSLRSIGYGRTIFATVFAVLTGLGVGAAIGSSLPGPPSQAASGASPAQEASRHLRSGLRLLESGRLQEAVEELRRAVDLRPGDPVAHYQLGRALFTLGRAEEAADHLETALQRAGDPGPVQFLLGQVRLETGELEAAADALQAAAASRPGYPPVNFYRAELCYRLGRVEEARRRLADLARVQPDWVVPRVRAGNLALEQEESPEAVEWFRSALEISPGASEVWLRLGSALVEDDEAEEALAAYRKAAELAPGSRTARIAVVGQLVNLDRHDEAMIAVDALLDRWPDHGVARHQRARLFSREGKHGRALAEVERALDGMPEAAADTAIRAAGSDARVAGDIGTGDRDRVVLLRAELLAKVGREDEAVQLAAQLLERHPDLPGALFLLGNQLLRRGDRSGVGLLERFQTLSDAREHRQLGDQFRLREGDLERARLEYRAALEAVPDDVGALLGLAVVERRTGAAEAALETLDRAREAGASSAEFHRERVLALHAAGRVAEARRAWQQARRRGLSLGPQVWSLMFPPLGGCGGPGGEGAGS